MNVSLPTRWIPISVVLIGGALRADVIERPIVLPKKTSGDLALLAFYSGGQSDVKGKGLAVVDDKDQPVGFKIINHVPTAQTWLAVDLRGVKGALRLRYDTQPLAESKPDPELQPSLVLRVFPYRNKEVKSANQVVKQLTMVKPMGTMAVSQINLAHNPFGPPTQYAQLYEGLLRINQPTKLRLFSSHDDAAFVEVNGKSIIKSTSPQVTRSSGALGKATVTVDLVKGTHAVRYLHVQTNGRTLAMLGTINSRKRAVPLSAGMFVHHPVATLGPAADAKAVGFDAQQVDQIAYEDTVFTRWRFRPIAPLAKDQRYRWAFGDGSTTVQDADPKNNAVEHVYVGMLDDLANWDVGLIRRDAKDQPLGDASSRVRPMPMTRVRSVKDADVMNAYAAAINRCEYPAASARVMARLYQLLWYDERPQRVAKMAEAFLARHAAVRDTAVWKIKYTLAGYIARNEPKRAADIMHSLSQTSKNSWRKACAAAWHLDILIFSLKKDEGISALAARLAAGRKPRERSLLMARLGDVHRLAGDHDKAFEAYQAAQGNTFREMTAREAAVVERAHREAVLEYLHQKRYPAMRDALFQWEADFPAAKMGGDLPLLTGRYFQELGDHRRAVVEFDSLLNLNPLHPSRPEIAYRLGQSLAQLGEAKEAEKWLNEVKTQYPNSPFAKK